MSVLFIAIASVLTYALGAVFGWRLGYVSGFENSRRSWPSLRREWHSDGVTKGLFSAVLWPVMLPGLLVGAHLTPTPPSVRAEERERVIREQRDEIRRLEREAGIR